MSQHIQYKKLGSSGLWVSPIIVGCMTYGSKKWADWVLEDEEKIFKILKKCYDVGIRTFDTADVYSNGKSEELLGRFLKKYDIPRDRVVILTKVYFTTDPRKEGFHSLKDTESAPYEYLNSLGLSRKHIFDAVEASVKRLGTHIDVLQIHRLDRSTPKTEIMRSLNDVILAGHVRYIGASSMKAVEFAQLQFVAEKNAADFVELQFIAEKNGWPKFISMQNFYNLIYREEEREMIPFCNENSLGKVGVIPWSPIARGLLARPLGVESEHNRTADTDRAMKFFGLENLTEADKEIIKRVEEVAKKHDVSMAIISSAWVLSKGAFPIIGLNSEERVDDAIKSLSVKLTDEELAYLEEPYQPKRVYGFV
ncbi:aryl-alcohol dehydrogenase [Scheffersomyces stipitis CBS 6054]|uniref:Aryl-alcohol dehydrogenases n=1 Tax=Scheffersomyces stipitis (strain ATCC 58785 / CBS 6054 / NBRC 10063 / NRRL Y-11545) TaxID=322104 RepID=A3GGR3_PICST|nr:aryl-alcohol dehydrogenases [Scheffersomyces stipitis CBS 6054]EAZ63575.1 aryl-alcohol dehydrogenase [Scheffersomyces stipitis CBS 6054]